MYSHSRWVEIYMCHFPSNSMTVARHSYINSGIRMLLKQTSFSRTPVLFSMVIVGIIVLLSTMMTNQGDVSPWRRQSEITCKGEASIRCKVIEKELLIESSVIGQPEASHDAPSGNGQHRLKHGIHDTETNYKRYYMNPVKALLQQNNWNEEFLREIEELGTLEKQQNPILGVVPKVEEVQDTEVVDIDELEDSTLHPSVSCGKLFNNDIDHYVDAEVYQRRTIYKLPSDVLVYNLTQNCEKFRITRKYILDSVSREEEDFPLAYSILVYKQTALLERLLRAIYRPQNFYCIHVDLKSPQVVHDTVTSLADCFNNVNVASKSVQVEWGRYGVLEADMICLQDLWRESEKQNRKWKYFINLTGQEFPLKTNWELVRILKTYDGAVDVGSTINGEWSFRTECFYYWLLKNKTCLEKKETPKYNFTIAKGPVHVAMPYAAAEFTLFSKISQYLLLWLNGTIIPDESFFPTLFSSPQLGIPGAYKGAMSTTKRAFHPMVRFKKWSWWRSCRGKMVRHICLTTLSDLPELKVRPEMFVNKFEARHHWLAYTCLEELHLKKVHQEIAARQHGLVPQFDTTAYKELPWIRNHV